MAPFPLSLIYIFSQWEKFSLSVCVCICRSRPRFDSAGKKVEHITRTIFSPGSKTTALENFRSKREREEKRLIFQRLSFWRRRTGSGSEEVFPPSHVSCLSVPSFLFFRARKEKPSVKLGKVFPPSDVQCTFLDTFLHTYFRTSYRTHHCVSYIDTACYNRVAP